MSKRFLAGLALILLAGMAATFWVYQWSSQTWLPPITDKELNAQMRRQYPQVEAPRLPVPVVNPFRKYRVAVGNIGLGDETRNRNISDLLLAELSPARGVEMVERQALDKILRELNLSLSGLAHAGEAVRVGELVKADWFLLGTPVTFNGTNSIIVRMVDAHTGVLGDTCVLDRDQPQLKLATALADFVRRSRQQLADGKQRAYVAFGTFQDLSPNGHAAYLPQELRSHLTAAYRNSGVTLLEREYAEPLLREAQLDLAGITLDGGTNVVTPMPSAYWFVDGIYQTYETTNLQVEIAFNVHRMFGRRKEMPLREKPGEPLFAKAKQALDQMMKSNGTPLMISRWTESRAQLAAGKELVNFGNDDWFDFVSWSTFQTYSPSEQLRRERNLEEASRAFQTVLLLDPTNRAARVCLAACLRRHPRNQVEEARTIYRELIDEPYEDRWSNIARNALLDSFGGSSQQFKRQWLASAAANTSSLKAAEFYRTNATNAAENIALQQGGTLEAEKIAEIRLFEATHRWKADLDGNIFIVDFDNTGLGKFVESFGNDSKRAAKRVADLLPQLQAAEPKLAPYLLAGVVSFQTDTNASVIGQFEQSFDEFVAHPEQLAWPKFYFGLISHPLSRWSVEHKLYRQAAKLFEGRRQAAKLGLAEPLDDEDTVALGYYLAAGKQWQTALKVFESLTNRPVYMGGDGLWGEAFTEVLPSQEAATCRERLGLPPVRDPRDFEMDTNCLCLHTPATFTTDSEGVWIATRSQLLRLDFNWKTNLAVRIPYSEFNPTTPPCIGASNVWIGTSGAGIIEFSKAGTRSRLLTEQDGLLMGSISSLYSAGDKLWIGYGDGNRGGFGCLDLLSGTVKSFTRSMFVDRASDPTLPPAETISDITPGVAGDLWLVSRSYSGQNPSLRRYRQSTGLWDTATNRLNDGILHLAADGERLMAGHLWPRSWVVGSVIPKNRVSIHSLRKEIGQDEVVSEELVNSASALTVENGEVWVGGEGFIALVDAGTGKIRKLTYVPAHSVEKIAFGGGYLWALYDRHLHRASMDGIR